MNDVDFPVARVLDGIDAAAAAGPAGQGQRGRQARRQRRQIVADGAALPRHRPHPALHRVHGRRRAPTAGAWTTSSRPPRSSPRSTPSSRSSRPSRTTAARSRGAGATRRRGEIGVIASVTQPFCGDCTRARLSAEGQLYTCLFARAATTCARSCAAARPTRTRARHRRHLEAPRRPLLRDPLRGHRRPAQGRDDLHRRLSRSDDTTRPMTAHVPPLPPGLRSVMAVDAYSGAALPAAWLGRSRPPARDLVRLPLVVPARPRPRRPRPDASAFSNGCGSSTSRRSRHRLYELDLRAVRRAAALAGAVVSWTYWNSEFTVVGLALLWVYFRRHEAFTRFRNSILLANVLGLLGYVADADGAAAAVPASGSRSINHSDGLIELAANPYAAMPSLHACDSLIVGISLRSVCRGTGGRRRSGSRGLRGSGSR